MPSRKWLWSSSLRFWLPLVVVLVGCTQESGLPLESWVGVCVDMDQDGYGFQCSRGHDCNDNDSSVHENCEPCAIPEQGCSCDPEAKPVECKLPVELNGLGSLLCKVGTRYCRDGAWGDCEGVVEFEAPAPSLLRTRAAVAPDASHDTCDPCNRDCYRARDPLLNGDGPFDNTASADGGGITLYTPPVDASVGEPPLLDDVDCTPGRAPDFDCDGIPDDYDPYPDKPPFASDHRTIFMDLAPGVAKSQPFDIRFFLNSADIYFYLDMTASMEDERDNLINSLTTGNYLPSSGSGVECADRGFDGTPDNALKTQGIAGNIACLIRDSKFGAGWFRDIPFEGPYANGTKIASDTFEMYENRQDITQNVEAVRTALQGFQTSGNQNVPEGSMQGLWSIATGGEVYAGWNRPGIPARRGCPAGTWGYPCFRESAVPIVIHITDAPLQNGPSPTSAERAGYLTDCKESERVCVEQTCSQTGQMCVNSKKGCRSDGRACTSCCSSFIICLDPCESVCTEYETVCTKYTCTKSVCGANSPSRHPLNYDSSAVAGMNGGTTKTYLPLTAAAESTASFQDVGDVTANTLVTYAGNTEAMASDHTFSNIGSCTSSSAWSSSSQGARDAVFKFKVPSRTSVTISTRGSHFDTTLLLRFVGSTSNVWCNDNISSGNQRSEITRTLDPGDYYVVLKGRTSSDNGWFQITFGNTAKQSSEAFKPKLWLGPDGDGKNGIREALLTQGVRVISVNSSNDAYLAEQSAALSTATGALSKTGTPLTFTIGSNGSGMGSAIIDAVNLLAGNLSMDVGVVLLESPEKPVPSFGFKVHAIDVPGDSCDPPVDTDNDPAKLPDTHKKCRPGATPRFSVTFENRLSHPVPLNPNDPKGGWNMKLQLIGDGTYNVSEIPVYIIPERVVPSAAEPLFVESGSYEERITAKGCKANEAPVWRTIAWNGKLPAGTRVDWQVCTGNTDKELDDCTLVSAAEVRPGVKCTMQSQCSGGYCDASGDCHFPTGPACVESLDCGRNGVCSDDKCTWTTGPSIDLKPLAVSLQGRPKARIRAVLYANPERTQAPIIRNWSLDYVCAQQE